MHACVARRRRVTSRCRVVSRRRRHVAQLVASYEGRSQYMQELVDEWKLGGSSSSAPPPSASTQRVPLEGSRNHQTYVVRGACACASTLHLSGRLGGAGANLPGVSFGCAGGSVDAAGGSVGVRAPPVRGCGEGASSGSACASRLGGREPGKRLLQGEAWQRWRVWRARVTRRLTGSGGAVPTASRWRVAGSRLHL